MIGTKALAPLLLLLSSCISVAPPARGGLTLDASRVLALVNEARAEARRCGSERLAAVPPLARSSTLDQVAIAHARDMAAQERMSHSGADGSTPGERATRAGYRWKTIGENVAYGQSTSERVVASWLASAGHCSNIMDPDFTETGIGLATGGRDRGVPYWSQVFGKPAS